MTTIFCATPPVAEAHISYHTSSPFPCRGRFLSNIFAIGQVYAFALYFDALAAQFHASYSTTSWVGSCCISMFLGFGVFSGKLIAIYGVRTVIITGGVFAGAGLLITSFMPSLYPMYFTYGIVIGVKHSLICFMCSSVGQAWAHPCAT